MFSGGPVTSSLLRTNLAFSEGPCLERLIAERGCEVLGSKGGKIEVGWGAREEEPRAPVEQGKEESKILGE